MKKLTVICIVILVLLTGCTYMNVPEPEQCSLCAGLPCHAPCIINLSTGEMLELAVYEPHPFIAGELAEEQQSETFSFVRGAGVEGYKLSAESIIVKVPMNADKMEEADGSPFTAHTTNVVPFLAAGVGDVKMRKGGCLADIAPTMLPYVGLPVPKEMTGKSIIEA